jgi:type IV pilus assembly protein PilP
MSERARVGTTMETRFEKSLRAAALACAAGLALIMAGCGQSQAPAPAAAPAARKAPAKPADEGKALRAAAAAYRYDSTNKPDPFKPFIFVNKKADRTSPLQKFDVGQITLKAVVWGVNNAKAMVEDPTGKGYVVQVGTDIGKNNGKVIGIKDRQVLVRETYVDYTGRATTKDVTLKIMTPSPDGEES